MGLNLMMVNTLNLALILDSERFVIQPKIVNKNRDMQFSNTRYFSSGGGLGGLSNKTGLSS